MNNLTNKTILSDEFWVVIDKILKATPDVVFGGSLALNAIGLINREIKDLDLFFPITTFNAGFMDILNHVDTGVGSDTVTDINGIEIERTALKINNVKACCFKVPKEQLEHSIFVVNGRNLRIQNVNHAISAKICYSKHNPKHTTDLENINVTLAKYF